MSSKERSPDPLDAAIERLERADEATKLLEYSEDFEEPTGRHEVTVNLHNPHPSQHELEVPATKMDVTMTVAKRLPPVALAIVVTILGLAAIGAYFVLKLRGAL